MTHETVDVSAQHAMRSRREFLKLTGMTVLSVGGLMFLAGCGPAPQDDGGDSAADGDAGSAQLGDGKTLRVGMEAAYAPYNWQVSEESDFTIPIENVSGAYADGYDVQVAKIIAEELGVEAVAVKLEFGSLIDALNNGQVDIVCAGMSVTPERAAAAAFSDSYVDDDIIMITKKDSAYAGATTFAELKDASILGQAATMYDDVIEQIPDVNHMTPAETVPMVVENLRNAPATSSPTRSSPPPSSSRSIPTSSSSRWPTRSRAPSCPITPPSRRATMRRSTGSTRSSPASTSRTARICGLPAWIASPRRVSPAAVRNINRIRPRRATGPEARARLGPYQSI